MSTPSCQSGPRLQPYRGCIPSGSVEGSSQMVKPFGSIVTMPVRCGPNALKVQFSTVWVCPIPRRNDCAGVGVGPLLRVDPCFSGSECKSGYPTKPSDGSLILSQPITQ